MRQKHCLTWNTARNSEKRAKCEIYTDLEHGEKTEKRRKMRNTQHRTWNMARNSEKCEK
uniref:Uncharacterized protein n=1 Tax=Trichinella nativa TaxID=6335 RepID=A0A0V1KJQ4_9BILA